MIIIQYLIGIIINFCFIGLVTLIFGVQMKNIFLRIFVLSLLTLIIGAILNLFGVIGSLINFVLGFILIMKILGYNFFKTTLFIIFFNLFAFTISPLLLTMLPSSSIQYDEKESVVNRIDYDSSLIRDIREESNDDKSLRRTDLKFDYDKTNSEAESSKKNDPKFKVD